MPSFLLRSGLSGSAASSIISCTYIELLTADPRVDNVYKEVKEEVDQDDPHGDDEDNTLNDEVVTETDRRDQGVTESGDIEEVLDNEATGQESPDVDAGRSKKCDRRRAKSVAPHNAALTQALRARHGDVFLLQGGNEVTAKDS